MNPETSSDSPSVKSNGARLVSARVETNHMRARGHVGRRSHSIFWVVLKVDSENPPIIRINPKIIRARATSYEIVCATARRAPMRAYLEFEAQPDPKMV